MLVKSPPFESLPIKQEELSRPRLCWNKVQCVSHEQPNYIIYSINCQSMRNWYQKHFLTGGPLGPGKPLAP